MILTRLTLNDFGIFRGCQSVMLTPQPAKPIILFGGKNGAGKSSLLEAIRLCLYGSLALGPRSSKESYLNYLESRIHSNPSYLIQPKFSSLSLEFQYADVDAVHAYTVTRSWERRSTGNMVEHLELQRNGKLLDEIEGEHWQDFVRDLIPPGLSQLFFFDGEKIQQLAEDTSDQQTLGEAIKSLLGLDVIERLQTDTGIYLSRLSRPGQNGKQAHDVEELEKEIGQIEEKLQVCRTAREEHARRIAALQSAIGKSEAKIAAEGGSFAKNREQVIEQQANLKSRIKQHEETLRQLCSGLLPFALAPKLCLQLKEQLLLEDLASQREAGKALLKSARRELLQRLEDPKLWKHLDLSAPAKRSVRNRIRQTINTHLEIEQTDQVPLVHQLSPSTQRQVLSWVDQATNDLPKTIKSIGIELETLHRELDKVESGLRKVPPDEILKPLLEELYALHRQSAEASKLMLLADDEIRSSELRLAELQRKHKEAYERLREAAGQVSKSDLVHNVQKVLEEYKGKLLERKIRRLEETVSGCFNALCRKKDALRKISVNARNFSVTLYDKRNQPLPKEQLSAGEKQIYAISMLWALAKTSGRPLPVIIDTPLARLDSDHRRLLIHHYFPAASHQVMILSTDTEVDQSYFNELRRDMAHAYRLDFEPEESCTKITPGYFWRTSNEAH